MGRSFLWLVMGWGWFAAGAAWGHVHVFLGFMPDEANEILTTLLASEARVPLVAIQGGDTGGVFFGKPVATYSHRSHSLLGPADQVTGKDSAAQIGQVLRRRFAAAPFRAALQRGASSGFNRTLQEGQADTSLSLLSFGQRNTAGRDLIVVLLNPETGRQPGLVQPFLAEILKGLAELPQAGLGNGGLHLSVYATSGGVSRAVRPGHLSSVAASVFVGSEVGETEGKKTYRALIAFAALGAPPVILLHKAASSREEAEQLAVRAFLDYESLSVAGAGGTPISLSRLVHDAKDRGNVSLTASFFIGPEMKEKGNQLGIANANMEDFQTIGVSGLVDSFRLFRLITDPSHLPDNLRARIADWSKEPGYLMSTYEDALLWGLKGCPLSAMPESARWKALAGESAALVGKYLATVPGKEPGFVLDPFFAEIASEFLNELARGTAFFAGPQGTMAHSGILSARTAELLSPSQSPVLVDLVGKKSAELQILARAILAKAESGASDFELRRDLNSLLQAASHLDVPRGTPVFRELVRGLSELARNEDRAGLSARRKLLFLNEDGKLRFMARDSKLNSSGNGTPMETWVVNVRWDGNWGRQLRYIGSDGLNRTQQDRALYRSGLLTLGREKAQGLALQERRRVAQEAAKPIVVDCPHRLAARGLTQKIPAP